MMFESDDYDQILSQFELPETSTQDVKTVTDNTNSTEKSHTEPSNVSINAIEQNSDVNNVLNVNCKAVEEKIANKVSPKHAKRKIINSYFNHTSKRKFPGPAGLLNGSFKDSDDDSVCLQEILSQDFEHSQNCIRKDAFDSPLWKRLLEDLKSYKSGVLDTIIGIKQQRTAGDIRWRKAGTVAAFVEAVDRSNTDPLITLGDITGSIKCTLHRDAWSKFSSYLVPECCALVLSKPTVLTMGSRAIKNHYLNITMSNILAIYSSVSRDEENKEDLEGCEVENVEDFTIIQLDRNNIDKSLIEMPTPDAQGLFDGLDSIFSDEIF